MCTAEKQSLSHPSYLTRTGNNQAHLKQPQMQAETIFNDLTFQVALPNALLARM